MDGAPHRPRHPLGEPPRPRRRRRGKHPWLPAARAGRPGRGGQAFALATQGIGSAVVLNVLLWIGLVVSIPLRGFNPLYGTAAVAGALLIGGFGLLILLVMRGKERAARIVRAVARRAPFLHEDAAPPPGSPGGSPTARPGRRSGTAVLRHWVGRGELAPRRRLA